MDLLAEEAPRIHFPIKYFLLKHLHHHQRRRLPLPPTPFSTNDSVFALVGNSQIHHTRPGSDSLGFPPTTEPTTNAPHTGAKMTECPAPTRNCYFCCLFQASRRFMSICINIIKCDSFITLNIFFLRALGPARPTHGPWAEGWMLWLNSAADSSTEPPGECQSVATLGIHREIYARLERWRF